VIDQERFVCLTSKLADGLLREAIGYRIEYAIPYYQGIVGYMVEAPMLWIRHSRFPILFVAYDQRKPDVLGAVVKQLEMARTTEYFALLIVVPTRDWGTGNEAQQLRHTLSDSVYRYDFVVLDRGHLASIIARASSQRLVEIILEQGIELSTLSPYVVKGPVPERMFFGREKEIKNISQTLTDRDYAITGPRRIGKSSILLKLNRLLNNDPRYHAIYLNCEDKFDYQAFFDGIDGEIGESFENSDPSSFRQRLAGLRARSGSRRPVFLLDEIDELLAFDATATPALQLFRIFRSLSHEGSCHFAVSGGRTLVSQLRNPASPFFNFCHQVVLGTLEERSVAEIVSKPLTQLGVDVPEEEALIDRVIDVTSCHPNIAQWVCDKLLRATQNRCVTLKELEAVSSDPEFHEHYVDTAWGDATALEQLISLVMDGPAFEMADVADALSRFNINGQARILEALQMLQLGSLIHRQGGAFRFKLSHFPAIVRSRPEYAAQVQALTARIGST
jgi:hypothetical protein